MKATGIGQLLNIKNILFWVIIVILFIVLYTLWNNCNDGKEEFSTFGSSDYKSTNTRATDYALANEFTDLYTALSQIQGYESSPTPLEKFLYDIQQQNDGITSVVTDSKGKQIKNAAGQPYKVDDVVSIVSQTRDTIVGFMNKYETKVNANISHAINKMMNNYLVLKDYSKKYNDCVNKVTRDTETKNSVINSTFDVSNNKASSEEQKCYDKAQTQYWNDIDKNPDDSDTYLITYMNSIDECKNKYNATINANRQTATRAKQLLNTNSDISMNICINDFGSIAKSYQPGSSGGPTIAEYNEIYLLRGYTQMLIANLTLIMNMFFKTGKQNSVKYDQKLADSIIVKINNIPKDTFNNIPTNEITNFDYVDTNIPSALASIKTNILNNKQKHDNRKYDEVSKFPNIANNVDSPGYDIDKHANMTTSNCAYLCNKKSLNSDGSLKPNPDCTGFVMDYGPSVKNINYNTTQGTCYLKGLNTDPLAPSDQTRFPYKELDLSTNTEKTRPGFYSYSYDSIVLSPRPPPKSPFDGDWTTLTVYDRKGNITGYQDPRYRTWESLGIDSINNFSVSFDFKFTAVPDSDHNIFHITNNNKNCCALGDRNPALWILKWGGTTPVFHFATSSLGNGNDWKNFNFDYNVGQPQTFYASLSFNTLSVKINGKEVFPSNYATQDDKNNLTYNGHLTDAIMNALVYCPDPWHNPTDKLLIKNLKFSKIYDNLSTSGIKVPYFEGCYADNGRSGTNAGQQDLYGCFSTASKNNALYYGIYNYNSSANKGQCWYTADKVPLLMYNNVNATTCSTDSYKNAVGSAGSSAIYKT